MGDGDVRMKPSEKVKSEIYDLEAVVGDFFYNMITNQKFLQRKASEMEEEIRFAREDFGFGRTGRFSASYLCCSGSGKL